MLVPCIWWELFKYHFLSSTFSFVKLYLAVLAETPMSWVSNNTPLTSTESGSVSLPSKLWRDPDKAYVWTIKPWLQLVTIFNFAETQRAWHLQLATVTLLAAQQRTARNVSVDTLNCDNCRMQKYFYFLLIAYGRPLLSIWWILVVLSKQRYIYGIRP